MSQTLLLVSNNEETINSLTAIIRDQYQLKVLGNPEEMLIHLKDSRPALALIDNVFEPPAYPRILATLKKYDSRLPVVFLNLPTEIKTAVLVLKNGAETVLTKPLEKEKFLTAIGGILKFQPERTIFLKAPADFPWLLGSSPEIQDFIRALEKAAAFHCPLILAGKPGSHFKEIAQVLHQNSIYANQNFIYYNFSDVLSEKEFHQRLEGYLENLSEQPWVPTTFCLEGVKLYNLQLKEFIIKVLRKSQAGQYREARFVIGTPDRLLENFMEESGLESQVLRVPSLAERRSDIIFLVTELVEIYNLKFSKNVKHISSEVLEFFTNYSWPGQTREMENLVKTTLAVLPREAEALGLADVPVSLEKLFHKEIEKNIFQKKYNLEQAVRTSWPEVARVITEQLGADNFLTRFFH